VEPDSDDGKQPEASHLNTKTDQDNLLSFVELRNSIWVCGLCAGDCDSTDGLNEECNY